MISKSEIIKLATDWANGEPWLCAEIAVELDRLYESAYAEGFKAALSQRAPQGSDK
jgi:hypothetical protein